MNVLKRNTVIVLIAVLLVLGASVGLTAAYFSDYEDQLGVAKLNLSGEELTEIDVIAASDVERSFWKYNLHEIPGFFRSKYVRSTFTLGMVLSVLYIGLCVFFAFRYHEERKRRAAVRAGHLQNRNR